MNLPKFHNQPGPPPDKDFNNEVVEEMAYHGFSIEEICEVMEVDKFWFGPGKKLMQIYRKGFLKSQLELRQRIFIDAKHGSSPAQALAKKILDDAEYKLKSE